jgi:hypothetical protein
MAVYCSVNRAILNDLHKREKMKADEWGTRFEEKPASTTLMALIIGFGIIIILMVMGWGFGVISMPFRSASGVAEKTLNPDNVIYNYEWFRRQHQDVLAMDVKLAAAEGALESFEQSAGPRKDWKFDDRTEWNRLNSIVLGLRGQRADMVAQYNARANMANRSIFMGDEVPAHIQ